MFVNIDFDAIFNIDVDAIFNIDFDAIFNIDFDAITNCVANLSVQLYDYKHRLDSSMLDEWRPLLKLTRPSDVPAYGNYLC